MSNAAVPLLNLAILGSFMVFSLVQVRQMQLAPARQRRDEQRRAR